jgi:F-type H+-transporting ATPase subunit a
MEISVAAEKLAQVGSFPITNSLVINLFVSLVLVGIGVVVYLSAKLVPGAFQNLIEATVEPLYALIGDVAQDKAPELFSLIITLFLFIVLSSWAGLIPYLIPGARYLGVRAPAAPHERARLVPLFRGGTADLNTTIALALIAVVAIQYYGLKHLGVKIHLGKFLNFKSPVGFFVGILELVSEFAKIISFAFRLFGNIFAGEVLLVVIISLVPLLAPLPFLVMEIFVGLIQALVFAVLTLVFISVAMRSHAGSLP